MRTPVPGSPLRRRLKRAAQLIGVLTVAFLGVVLIQAWPGFGGRPDAAELARMHASPQWHGSSFDNPQPLHNKGLESVTAMFDASPYIHPDTAVAVTTPDPESFETAPVTGLRVTWFGHSTTLIELDGKRFLTDPIFSDRAGPLTWLGPTRYYPPALALEKLPHVDAVIISHDHYDHLDAGTIRAMAAWQDTTFICALGVAAHLRAFGIKPEHIVELDWWQSTKLGDVEVTCAPARHASGRQVFDKDATLWAGYAIRGPTHRAYFSGDTGLFPAMKDIGTKLGPFDVTLLECGQYNPAWPDWHMGPEQSVTAHEWLQGRVLIPIHWGLFTLAVHGWTEPVERVLAQAEVDHQTVLTPRPGQSVEPEAPVDITRWWPKLPFKTGAQDPIHSSQLE